MTRISSLFVASALAILPISAFAQQAAVPSKTTVPTATTTQPTGTTTAPSGMTTAAPHSDKAVTGTTAMDKTAVDKTAMDKAGSTKAPADATANVTQPAKPDAKPAGHGVKNDVHGSNGVTAPHAKAGVPAKTVDPAKS